jgi:hypothetical protein
MWLDGSGKESVWNFRKHPFEAQEEGGVGMC